MKAHVFGEASSPSCSNFDLWKTESGNRHENASDVSRILEKKIYVDDMLKSIQTVTKGDVVRKSKELWAKGGFNLSKFTSTIEELFKSIADEDKRRNVSYETLKFGKLPEDKVLGVKWNISKDTLGFQTKMAGNLSPRGGLLSMLTSIFDPFGLGGPFLLKGRLIIQRLCRDRLGWDEPKDEKSSYELFKWKYTMMAMDNINIPRCYKPAELDEIVEYALHHFSDVSETEYGYASYLRMSMKMELFTTASSLGSQVYHQ